MKKQRYGEGFEKRNSLAFIKDAFLEKQRTLSKVTTKKVVVGLK